MVRSGGAPGGALSHGKSSLLYPRRLEAQRSRQLPLPRLWRCGYNQRSWPRGTRSRLLREANGLGSDGARRP